MSEKELVLFDTDIGSDIDDAVCLAYLLMQPYCELVGITTVTGEAVKRAMLADAVCRVAGKRVPIYAGAEIPMLTAVKQPIAQQAQALPNWEHSKEFSRGAISFMRDIIHENPGKITLLAVGPMTNLGLLFATYPETAGMLKSLVLMCGVFTNRLPGVGPLEWNALNDPYATAIVYKAKAARHRSIGLDVTCRVVLEADEVRRRFTHPVLQPVKDFAEVWFKHAKKLTFHDPLAAVSIFEDNILSFTRGNVESELQSARLMGMTHFAPDDGGVHEVALDVDPDLFFEKYFSVF